MHDRNSPARRGSAYVLVLACGAIISIVGVAGIFAATLQRNSVKSLTSLTQTRASAQSALEGALARADNTLVWRTDAATNAFAATPANMPKFSVVTSDPVDGTLANNLADDVILRSSAENTDARQLATITLAPQTSRMRSMSFSIVSDGDITFNASQILTRSGIHSNGTIKAVGSTYVGADVSAVGTITGTTYLGTVSPLAAKVTLPDATILDPYVAQGVKITYASIGGGAIDKALLSPTANPYGASVSPTGLYVIDCGNKALTIKNARILGTLVITRCTLLTIDGQVCWEPASQTMPALLTDSPIDFRFESTSLNESNANTNLNPAGTPYRGLSNTTKTDLLASVLSGVYFTTGNVTCSAGKPTFEGRLLAKGSVSINSGRVRFRENIGESMIPGFIDYGKFLVTPGTLRRDFD